MRHRSFCRFLPALLGLATLVLAGAPALAGTTGTLSGTALETASHAPIVGAKVTAASPSEVTTTTTDGSGHFVFLSLAPDTYTVSIEQSGYESVSVPGVTVVADQGRVIGLSATKSLRTIGRVTARAATSLVKPGTTADVYAVNAVQQEKFQGLGGGGLLNNAYSAVSTVPGAFVPTTAIQGGNGITPNIYIRGGDYDQIGFELDGIPINRSFDNYPSGPGSTLGQQELEVYTGANPANSEGQGLAGFINQVIRIGTYPGFAQFETGIGGPSFYNKGGLEVGGATQNRNFTYYFGLDAYDQSFRFVDQFNGAGVSQSFGVPLSICPGSGITPSQVPSCFAPNGQNYTKNVFAASSAYALTGYQVLGSAATGDSSHVGVRDTVANIHIGLPRKSGLRDDIQILGMANFVRTSFYSSTNDQGGATYLNNIGLGQPYFIDGYQYAGSNGVVLPSNYRQLTSVYWFPTQPGPRTFDQFIPVDQRDAISNNQGILKLQYTHAFSQSALPKVYGYTYYSDWLQGDPQSAYANYLGPGSADYELSSHTRGVSGTLSDQLNAHHLLQLQSSYTTSRTVRDNNTQMYNGLYPANDVNARTVLAAMVDSTHPYNGICYAMPGSGAAATPVSCAFPGTATGAGVPVMATIGEAFTGTVPSIPSGLTCGGGPCSYYTVNNGQYATYNTVKPQFTALSLTDQWRPTERISIDGGLRLDSYGFVGSNTAGSPARTFWYNAFNLDNCLDANDNLIAKSPTASCPTGTRPANVQNPSGIPTQTYNEWQPRIAGTYQLNPTTVFRASYGRYTEAPNSAFQQYDALQQDAPYVLYSTYGFQKFGFLTPAHDVRPPTSNNLDFSYEHQFPNDYAVKVTPFLRKTQDQIQLFYLNQATNFVSGLNVGRQTAEGVEFELDKGNFAQNGISAKLSFTYTNSYIQYTSLSNGTSVITPLNSAIQSYNAYTSYCANHSGSNLCGSTLTGAAAAPCYSSARGSTSPGVPISCSNPGAIANPYWNAPVQDLLAVNGNYPTFDILPAGIGSAVSGYGAPYFAALVMQYKREKFAVTPSLQFNAGQRYGAPETTFGVAPDLCGPRAGSTVGDPRYPYGSAGGAPYAAGTCATNGGNGLVIPDPYTKTFDSIGAFIAPSQLAMHLQLSYQASRSTTLVANLTNIVNYCFGGTKTGFTVPGACSYSVIGGGTGGDVGNDYNPGAIIQPYVNVPYAPLFAQYPFGFFLSAKVRM